MTHIITWTELKESAARPLPLGDRIEVSESRHEGSYLEITLEIGPNIAGWRCVTLAGGEVVDGVSEIWLARLELEKPWRGPISFRADNTLARSNFIVLQGKSGAWTLAQ